MSWADEYRNYLRGYAEARLGPYPEALSYNVVVTHNPDDDVAMFTIKGHVSTFVYHGGNDNRIFTRTDHDLPPIVLTLEQVEDNWAPRMMDEKRSWPDCAPPPPR